MMSTRDILLALFVALLWGFNFVVMKVGVGELPPLLLAALRFFLAAVPFVFIWPRPDVPWRLIVAFGLLFGVVKFGLLFWAMRAGMPAGPTSSLRQMASAVWASSAYSSRRLVVAKTMPCAIETPTTTAMTDC